MTCYMQPIIVVAVSSKANMAKTVLVSRPHRGRRTLATPTFAPLADDQARRANFPANHYRVRRVVSQ